MEDYVASLDKRGCISRAQVKFLKGESVSLEQVGESEYAGKMHVRIGPVSGMFAGKITVSDEVPPESFTLTVEGKGAPGFAQGTGHVELIEHEEGKTLMLYDGDMQVGGRIAGVGQRLIDTASRSMIGQGLESCANLVVKAFTTGIHEDGHIPGDDSRGTDVGAALLAARERYADAGRSSRTSSAKTVISPIT